MGMKCHGRCCSLYYTIFMSNTFTHFLEKKGSLPFLVLFISSLGNSSSFALNLLINYFSQFLGTELTTKATFSVVQKTQKNPHQKKTAPKTKQIFAPPNSPSIRWPNHVAFQHATQNTNPCMFKGMCKNLDHASPWWCWWQQPDGRIFGPCQCPVVVSVFAVHCECISITRPFGIHAAVESDCNSA